MRAVTEQQERLQRLERELHKAVKGWRLSPVVEAIQALRGVERTGAVILMAEFGDISRFDTPRRLMSYLGLTPSECSSGARRRQGGITKAGNSHARPALAEGAWAYRYPAKVSRHLRLRLEKLPVGAQAIGWKAQVRLCRRYRQWESYQRSGQAVRATRPLKPRVQRHSTSTAVMAIARAPVSGVDQHGLPRSRGDPSSALGRRAVAQLRPRLSHRPVPG